MSRSISNIKREGCWSCKYYAGTREYRRGDFEVDEKGQCLKRKSNNRDGSTIYSWHCSYYERAGDVEAYIQKEETEKEITRKQRKVENYQRRENEKLKKQIQDQRDQIEQERLRLESERQRLENERWLNSLSPEERERYLAEEKRKKELEELERECRAKTNQKLLEAQNKLKEAKEMQKGAKKEKRRPFIWLISFLAITLVAFGLGWIPYLSNISEAEGNEAAAYFWKELGHSTDDETYLEWVSLAEQYRAKADEVLYIPYLILGIFLVLTIAVTVLLLFRRKKKLEAVENRFNQSKKEALQLVSEAEKMTKENMEAIKKFANKQEASNDTTE